MALLPAGTGRRWVRPSVIRTLLQRGGALRTPLSGRPRRDGSGLFLDLPAFRWRRRETSPRESSSSSNTGCSSAGGGTRYWRYSGANLRLAPPITTIRGSGVCPYPIRRAGFLLVDRRCCNLRAHAGVLSPFAPVPGALFLCGAGRDEPLAAAANDPSVSQRFRCSYFPRLLSLPSARLASSVWVMPPGPVLSPLLFLRTSSLSLESFCSVPLVLLASRGAPVLAGGCDAFSLAGFRLMEEPARLSIFSSRRRPGCQRSDWWAVRCGRGKFGGGVSGECVFASPEVLNALYVASIWYVCAGTLGFDLWHQFGPLLDGAC